MVKGFAHMYTVFTPRYTPLYISFCVHICNPVMYRDSLNGNVSYS